MRFFYGIILTMNVARYIRASVIIPCWNVAPWLPRCLDEVFAALPTSAEVIAVDDGSDDETPEILARYASVRPELKVFSRPNGGVSAARNRGIGEALGEYVFFVDPDDGVEPDFFTSMLERIEETGADYCLCAFRTRRADGSFDDARLKASYELDGADEILKGYISRIIGYSFDDVRRFYAGETLFATREMASVCRACFRRALIEKASVRFDETVSLYEDAVFNAEYLLSAKKMTCIDRPLYRVTERESGAMRTIPRDAARFARNKLSLLSARIRLDEKSGGRIWPLSEASSVFSVLEIISLMMKFRLSLREGFSVLQKYLGDARARRALYAFPLSPRRPLFMFAVVFLRFICKCNYNRRTAEKMV